MAEINKAIRLNPITPIWNRWAEGKANLNLGQYEKAITSYKKSLLVNPDDLISLYFLGEAYRMTGQYEEAIAAFKKVTHLSPNFLDAHISLAASYSLTGQDEKSHAKAKEVLKINPKFSVDGLFTKGSRFSCYEGGQKDVFINALREAGLK